MLASTLQRGPTTTEKATSFLIHGNGPLPPRSKNTSEVMCEAFTIDISSFASTSAFLSTRGSGKHHRARGV